MMKTDSSVPQATQLGCSSSAWIGVDKEKHSQCMKCACLLNQNLTTARNLMFVYFWLCWVFIAAGFSLVVASRGCSLLWCAGFSLWWLLLLQSTGSRQRVSVVAHGLSSCSSQALDHCSIVVAHELSCSVAGGTLPDQGSNLCLLHWQADSLPLDHQGRPRNLEETLNVLLPNLTLISPYVNEVGTVFRDSWR